MPPRILVVDDEPDLQHLVRQNFRRRIRKNELEFFFAQNGKEALDVLAEQGDIDIVLSDINMPVMDGLALVENITEKYPSVRAVIVSAYGDMENIRIAMNNGAFDFVNKPIDFSDLEITIEKTLREVENLKKAQANSEHLLKLRQEMEIGKKIQLGFLPGSLPEPEGWNVAAGTLPARDVGGDFYDAFYINGKKEIALVLADVCGKGVGAALFMALIRSLIRAFAFTFSGDAENTLNTITNNVQRYIDKNHGDSGMFATLFIGILNPETGELNYINAGHCPPVILNGGNRKSVISPTGPAVGIFEDAVYKTGKLTLDTGDLIFIYTDGVTDAENNSGEQYGEKNLDELIDSYQGDAAGIVELVNTTLKEFSGNAAQADDITMIAVSRNK